MTDEHRDPAIQTLFADAEQELLGEAFTAGVMNRALKKARRARVARLAVGAMIAFLAFSLQGVVIPLSHSLVAPLIELNGLLAQMLAPVNSLAGVLSVGLIGLRTAQKKLFTGYGS